MTFVHSRDGNTTDHAAQCNWWSGSCGWRAGRTSFLLRQGHEKRAVGRCVPALQHLAAPPL